MQEPLPFFPESSYAFACNQQDKPDEEKEGEAKYSESKGIIEARKKWVSGKHQRGEAEDSANQLCFRDEPFRNPEFAKLACEIYKNFMKQAKQLERYSMTSIQAFDSANTKLSKGLPQKVPERVRPMLCTIFLRLVAEEGVELAFLRLPLVRHRRVV